MHPKLSSSTRVSGHLFRQELDYLVPKTHQLRLLADRLDWDTLELSFQKYYSSSNGRRGISLRILIGLQLLKYMFDESDESVVHRLAENAAWQYFCGLSYYEIKSYCDGTTLGRFRNRVGQEGLELLLAETVRLGRAEKVYKDKDLEKVHVDTTVQEKNITFPHDVKHLVKIHKKLLKLLRKKKIALKQNYRRVIPRLMWGYFNNAKRNHLKEANRHKRKICTALGRLIRAIERKIGDVPVLKAYFEETLTLGEHFIAQALGRLASNSDKIYSPHEQKVECIAKGKVGKKYEFGNKVSFVTTDRNNFIVGCVAHHGRPHDSKTLAASLNHVEIITGCKPAHYCSVDLGYRGHGIKKKQVYVVHPRLNRLTKSEKKLTKRRGKAESVISFVKRRCRMGINYLAGITGDILNALSAAIAYNAKLLIRKLVKTTG